MLRRKIISRNICRTGKLSVELAPYRTNAEFLHDYYSVSTNLLKVFNREKFIQMDPDEETGSFLNFSRNESKKLTKRTLLPYFVNQKNISVSYSKWNLGKVLKF